MSVRSNRSMDTDVLSAGFARPTVRRSSPALGGGRHVVINSREHPVGWALLVLEFADAHEHLGKLIADLHGDSEYEEANLRIDLGHVLAHLNRAWARRNVVDDLTESEWDRAREFPTDLQPIA